MKPRNMIVVNINQAAETMRRLAVEDAVVVINHRREITLEDGYGRVVIELSPSEQLPSIGDTVIVHAESTARQTP